MRTTYFKFRGFISKEEAKKAGDQYIEKLREEDEVIEVIEEEDKYIIKLK